MVNLVIHYQQVQAESLKLFIESLTTVNNDWPFASQLLHNSCLLRQRHWVVLLIECELSLLLSSVEDVVVLLELHCSQDLAIHTDWIVVVGCGSEADAGTLGDEVSEDFRRAVDNRVGLIYDDQLAVQRCPASDTHVVFKLAFLGHTQVRLEVLPVSLHELLAIIYQVHLVVVAQHKCKRSSSVLYSPFALAGRDSPELPGVRIEEAQTVLSQSELSEVGWVHHHLREHSETLIS